MNLTQEKLLAFWRRRNEIFANPDNHKIIERYKFLSDLFDKYDNTDLTISGSEVKIDNEPLTFENGDHPNTEYFGCKYDGVTRDKAFEGVKEMANRMPHYKDMILQTGCMLGGFEYPYSEGKIPTMIPEFRIISNNSASGNDNGSLISTGLIRHPAAHFTDNNYFFNIIHEVKRIQDDSFDPASSRIALRWPSDDSDKICEYQRSTLNGRFPYKFFYMWAHRNKCLHLVSLQAYSNLIRQHEPFSYQDAGISQKYYDFASKDGWAAYSEKIAGIIPEAERSENFYSDLSKLLSILMLIDQGVRNIDEMLHTGNHAIVLWGPPGTGKTFTAKSIVAKHIENNDLGNNRFNMDSDGNYSGQWAIVQFHPNYTYEDFIGGIFPKLTGTELNYTLKEGIFKKMCDEACKHPDKNYYIIIDEINRADLSSVFGELMYALEYRGEPVNLPNFPDFVIPENVYLIGTMNSVDKSLTTFDLALRRRFSFFKLMPNMSVIEDILADYGFSEENLKQYVERCENLNKKIVDPQSHLQLGSDYQIGQAYFGKIKDFFKKKKEEKVNEEESADTISTFELERLWEYNIQPLLEEYLGGRVDDHEIQRSLESLYKDFTKPF